MISHFSNIGATSSDGNRSSPRSVRKIEDLIKTLNGKLKDIKQFIGDANPHRTELKAPLEGTEARIADFVAANGHTRPSHMVQLRRGLSLRALANDYNDWVTETFSISPVLCRAHRPEIGEHEIHLKEFVRQRPSLSVGSNIETMTRALRHGLKILVCEEVFGGVGISALLIFQYAQCQNLNYGEVDGLRLALQKQKEMEKFAHENADWLRQWQDKYDGKLSEASLLLKLILFQVGVETEISNILVRLIHREDKSAGDVMS